MNYSFKNTFLSALCASALIFTACSDDDDNDTPAPTGPTQNIVEIASGNDDFSILVEALVAADLVSVLEGPGPFTVFAPDNDSFNAFFDAQGVTDANGDGSRVDDAVAILGAPAVTQVLLYHVHPGNVPAASVPTKAYINTASTASPGANSLSLLIESRTSGVVLNNAVNVTTADLFATNGVIHAIDAVLTLPNVVDHAANNPDLFSALVNAVTAADLVETLSDPNATYTVFAPTNDAFADISSITAGLTTEQLVTVLTYHVLGTQVRAAQVTSGSVTTVSTQNITLDASSAGVTVTDVNGGVANVIATDVQGTNGVIHVLDKVLIPAL
jgi:transforming growth factor-beta-induced protein